MTSNPQIEGPLWRRVWHDFRGRAVSASLIFVLIATLDPFSLKTESEIIAQDAFSRITRTWVPDAAILSWQDRPELAWHYAEHNLEPKKPLPGEDWWRPLPPWTPIHVFLYDEHARRGYTFNPKMDGIVTSIPLDSFTDVFAYFEREMVSVIFFDLRLVNDMSLGSDFCDGASNADSVYKQWAKHVQKPPTDPSADPVADSRPMLLVAGHAPFAADRTTELIWDKADRMLVAPHVRESEHTVLPCVSNIAEVVQTEWDRDDPRSYPITVSPDYDPWTRPEAETRNNQNDRPRRYRASPALRILQAWCQHPKSVIVKHPEGDPIAACDWARSVELAAMPEMVPDWLALAPSIFCINDGGGDECSDSLPKDAGCAVERMRWQHEGATGKGRWRMIRDTAEQTFQQLRTFVPGVPRYGRVTCNLPAYWPGFLDEFDAPKRKTSNFEPSLRGATVIIAGNFEHALDRHHIPLYGSVPGGLVHGAALQSLIWRGENYTRDPPFMFEKITALTLMTPIEFLALNIAILLVVVASQVPYPRCRLWTGIWCRDAATEERRGETEQSIHMLDPDAKALEQNVRTFIAFFGVGLIVVVAASLVAMHRNFPVVDGLSVGLILGVAFIVRFRDLLLQSGAWFMNVCKIRAKAVTLILGGLIVFSPVIADTFEWARFVYFGALVFFLAFAVFFTVAVIVLGLRAPDDGTRVPHK